MVSVSDALVYSMSIQTTPDDFWEHASTCTEYKERKLIFENTLCFPLTSTAKPQKKNQTF